jgi:cell division protein FtsX
VDVSVLVDPTAPPAQLAALGQQLQATPGVTAVAFESRTAAVQRVRALNPKADKLVDYAGRGGMPASFRLRVRDRAIVAALRDRWCHAAPDGHLACTGGVLLMVDQAWLEGRQPAPAR